MQKGVIALSLTLLATSAQAQTRPSTVDMPCGASRQLVFARGAIVLGTGGSTYDRFVRDRTFCDVTEYAQAAYVPSRESPLCFVGYRCKQGPRDWWD
ncbi:hypothetical protein [Microvirga sp. VF16]|uniref:hypothetical protein n=1 Tax=Microvirga sp. VF16 TaxID=2807101 RepID=UPI00193E92DA|nr:hypothetical protein [Microvirga sp. VF16]QRM28356.1 hypothetical protein JO965_19255 [Microvirga sp. VF16]